MGQSACLAVLTGVVNHMGPAGEQSARMLLLTAK